MLILGAIVLNHILKDIFFHDYTLVHEEKECHVVALKVPCLLCRVNVIFQKENFASESRKYPVLYLLLRF